MRYSWFLIVFVLWSQACQTSDPGIEDVVDTKKEIATDIELFYSDSAITQFKIISPRRESYTEEKKLIEEYPLGIDVTFYDRDQNITSTMKAPYAKRISIDGVMIMRRARDEPVILVNAKGDKLTTPGIEWNEVENTLKTRKFVQLINARSRDTSYGIGFEALDDFSRFKITQLKGKRRYQDLTKD